MSYVLLFELLLLLWVMAWFSSGKDILAPSFVVVSLFLLVVALDIVGMSSWNQEELDSMALLIVVVGCGFFLLGSVFAGMIRPVRSQPAVSRRQSELRRFLGNPSIDTWKLVLLLVILCLCLLEKLYEVQRIGGGIGVGLSEAISNARFATNQVFAGVDADATEKFSVLEKIMEQFVLASAMALVCYISALAMGKSAPRKFVLPFTCFATCCAFSLLGGGRAGTLGYLLMFIVPLIVYRVVMGGNRRAISAKAIGAIAVLVAVLFSLFYLSLPLLGRQVNGGTIEYISFYFGAGIPSLSNFTSSGSTSYLTEAYPGLNTFYVIYSTLNKFGVVSALPPVASNFIPLGGHWTNVYTCFYRYYADFGIGGVAALSFVAGGIYTAVYRWATGSSKVYALPIWLLMFRPLIDVIRDETLFGHQLFSPAFYIAIAFVVVLTRCLFENGKGVRTACQGDGPRC